tara:strand:- start:1107 stop:1334 length:228 start_codon:yes stop_codon:yes gene_type:complete
MKKTLTQQVKDKLNQPTFRVGLKKQVVPPKLTDAQMNHLIFVMMKPMRDANLKKFGGGVQKNWNKMSRVERKNDK